MIEFNRPKLQNELTLLVHTDWSTSMVAVSTLYDVGARRKLTVKVDLNTQSLHVTKTNPGLDLHICLNT